MLHHAGKGARSERGTFDSLQQLDIAFRHGGLYRYFDVSRRTYRALMHAESKGQFFTGQIRGHYRFRKITDGF